MATTTLLGLAARAWGLPGSGIVSGCWEALVVEWTWSVLSQEAEMRRAGWMMAVSLVRLPQGIGRRSDVLTVLGAVDDAADGRGVLAKGCLLSTREINPIIGNQSLIPSLSARCGQNNPPLNLMVYARDEGLVLIRAEAHIKHGRTMLECPNQVRLLGAIGDLVKVHVLVP